MRTLFNIFRAAGIVFAICFIFLAVTQVPVNAVPGTLPQMLKDQAERDTGGQRGAGGNSNTMVGAYYDTYKDVQDTTTQSPQYPDGGPIHQGPQSGLHSLTQPNNVQRQTKEQTPPESQTTGPPGKWSSYQRADAMLDGVGEQNGIPWRVYDGDAEQRQAKLTNLGANEAFKKYKESTGNNPLPLRAQNDLANSIQAGLVNQAQANNPLSNFSKGKNDVGGLGQGASNTLADAFDPTWLQMLRLQNEGLLNVANEATGSPTAHWP